MPCGTSGGIEEGAGPLVLDLALSASLARDLSAADYLRVVATFAEDLDRLIDLLEVALAQDDAAMARAAAHGIAGVAATVGAVALERSVHGLVDSTGDGRVALLARLRANRTEALRALAGLVSGGPDSGP